MDVQVWGILQVKYGVRIKFRAVEKNTKNAGVFVIDITLSEPPKDLKDFGKLFLEDYNKKHSKKWESIELLEVIGCNEFIEEKRKDK